MRNISNTDIYYELRAQHRRKIAQCAFELTLFAFFFYELATILGNTTVLVLAFACGIDATLAYAWMFANQNPGRVRNMVESIAGSQDWPADIRQELERDVS